MMVMTYTDTMIMPAVMFDALTYAVGIKQRITRDNQAEETQTDK